MGREIDGDRKVAQDGLQAARRILGRPDVQEVGLAQSIGGARQPGLASAGVEDAGRAV